MTASPARIALAGPTDANGATSLQVAAPPTLFAVLTLAAQCAGNPNWIVTAFGQPLAYGNGPQVNLGPFLTSPGEVLQINVTGATPRTQIVGTLAGTQHESAEEAAGVWKPAANAVTINTFQGRQKLYPDGEQPATANAPSFTVPPPNNTVTKRFTLPPAAASLRILATANGLLFNYAVLVLGVQTVEQYWGNDSAPGSVGIVSKPTLPFTIPIERDWDSQVDITVQGDPNNSINFFISALAAAEAPGQAGNSQSVVEPTPAYWQAGIFRAAIPATSVAGAGGILVIVPPQGALAVVQPVRYSLFQDGANLAGRWQLQDTFGVIIHDMQCTNVRGLLDRGNLDGVGSATANAGLQLLNGGAAASFVSGTIDYQIQV